MANIESNTAAQPAGGSATDRRADADKTIKYHMWAAVGASILPVPLLDVALFAGIQLNMLRFIAKIYGVRFSDEVVKSLIGAIVGGTSPIAPASLIKAIPVIGHVMGVLSFTAVAGASTYALGKVFVQHFESGGTFLTLDPNKVRDHYAQQYAQGKAEVATGNDYAGVKP